jgi:hypothetical protein
MTQALHNSAAPNPLTLDEALLFGFFVHQHSEAASYDLLDTEGYFRVSQQQLEKLPLDDMQQQKAFNGLIIRGYVAEKINISSNSKTYKVYVDALLADISWS